MDPVRRGQKKAEEKDDEDEGENSGITAITTPPAAAGSDRQPHCLSLALSTQSE